MGKQINFLKSLPTVLRDPKLLEARRKVKEYGEVHIPLKYDFNYFDGIEDAAEVINKGKIVSDNLYIHEDFGCIHFKNRSDH